MNIFKNTITLATILILSSCSSTTNFPISKVTPGAKMEVKISKDDYNNSIFNISTQYLTSPERLTPPKNIYIVWVKTENMGTINLGKLYSKTSDKASLKTSTPFKPLEIFITAEENAFVKTPLGIEITRLKL